MIKVLLFDFDGTIADSFEVVQEVFYEITGSRRIEDPDEIRRLRQMSMIKAAKELQIKPWQLPKLLIRGRALMAAHIDKVEPFKGIEKVIDHLHAEGYQMYVMSSNSAQNVQQFLQNHTLDKYFIRVYGNIGLLGKASAIRSVARHNHFSAEECAYIGDEVRDIEGAKKAGAFMISVGWGYNDGRLLKTHHPDALAATPKEIITALQRNRQHSQE